MSKSSNEVNLIGGSSAHSNGVGDSATASPDSNVCLGSRLVLKELNTNENISMLASKAALNNCKVLTSPASSTQIDSTKISAATTGSVSSTPLKIRIDSQLEVDVSFDDHKQQQQGSHHQYAPKDNFKNSGVNKSSNKFVGLTEFDEAKIPELPGDLNPNIEEQYKVTFEEGFIPTLNAEQGTIATDEFFKVEATHFYLPSEAELTSSDNETFADCDEEKDPLASTFVEESFQSFGNTKSLNSTTENIADITMEAVGQPLQNVQEIQTVEQPHSEHLQTHVELMDEDEPMDVDMNETMEIIHNTSNNIQHVERVLEHAENILQNLEDKNVSIGINAENVTGLLEKQSDSSEEAVSSNTTPESVAVNKRQHHETEKSRHELSLNKSIEMLVNKSKTPSIECLIANLNNKDVTNENTDNMNQLKNESDNNVNSSNDGFNSSTISNSSAKSLPDSKSETNTTGSLNSSLKSQNSSTSRSPPFPSKSAQSPGFPRSPKAVAEKVGKSPFLEKSDYLTNNETQAEEVKLTNNLNESPPNSTENNLNDDILKPAKTVEEENKRRTFGVYIAMTTSTEEQKENNTPNEDKMADEKRRTFSVETSEFDSTSVMKFPSMDKEEKELRTFSKLANESLSSKAISVIDKSDVNSRRTFNLPSEEFTAEPTQHIDSNTSYESMDVDDHFPEETLMPLPTDEKQRSQSPHLQNSQFSPLPNILQRSKVPSSPVIKQKSQTDSHTVMQEESDTVLPAMETNSQSSLPRSKSSPSPTERPKTQSPPPQTTQSKSPPLPAMQSSTLSHPTPITPPKSLLPSIPNQSSAPLAAATLNISEIEPNSPPKSTAFLSIKIKEEPISPPSFEATHSSFASQPLSKLIQKRPPIRDARARAADILSAKEQSNIKVRDEKDILVEKQTPSPIEDVFPAVSATSSTLTNSLEFSDFGQTSSSGSSVINTGEQQTKPQQIEDEFCGNNLILNPSDFDYLLTKGNNNTPVDRSSLLLKFDPLLGVPVPVNQGQQQLEQLQIPTKTINPYLSPTLEEDEHNDTNSSIVIDTNKSEASAKQELKQKLQLQQQVQQNKRQLTQGAKKKNATMSVDVIKDMSLDNDCNKTFEKSNSTQSDDKQINYKMDELEKKIKNEVLKTEDIEKKLKDAEQREEALIKRITEKDKTIAKMTGVIEAYEKAIAELIADKEQLTQHYEKQLAEVKGDRDSNYHHLTSLETTFSDLHVKYEKSKEMTCQLKESEDALQAEKRKNLENLKLQEQRYDRMRNHAVQQLDLANKKLESLTRDHSIEITKLKALLKKEEIARSSINEQLAHKTKENAELVKICDELISGQGSNFSFEPFDSKKH